MKIGFPHWFDTERKVVPVEPDRPKKAQVAVPALPLPWQGVRVTGSNQPSSAAPRLPSPGEVRTAYREELRPHQRAGLLAWLSFTGTFAGVRALTYSIRAGRGPFRNLTLGGEHLHHYMWGIGMLTGIGGVAVRGEDRARRHPAVALIYGAAVALIVDEFALLLDLQDVYWAQQGRISVDLGVGTVAAGGTTLAALPVLRRLQRNRRGY